MGATETCPYCGGLPHNGICPLIAAIDYFPDGHIRRVELFHVEHPLYAFDPAMVKPGYEPEAINHR